MASTFSNNKGYELMATGEDNGTWGIKTNANLSLLDSNFGGRFNKDVSGSSNVTVTAPQAENVCHILTGVLTGNIQYIFPATGAFYWVTNNTTGAFNITLAMTGGTITRGIAQGETVGIFVNPDGNYGVKFLTTNETSRIGPYGIFSTAGTANAQTATLSGPANELGQGVNAMGNLYEIVPSLSNTGPMTLAINGQPALTVANTAIPGSFAVGQLYLAQSNGASILNLIASNLKYAGYVLRGAPQSFGVSGTYNSNPGVRAVLVLTVGGGAGGSGARATTAAQQCNGGGGGGGGWSLHLLTTTGFTGGIAVTVALPAAGGIGAAAGATGGTTSFGGIFGTISTGGNPSTIALAQASTAAGVNGNSQGGQGGTGLFFGSALQGGTAGFGLCGTGGAANMGGQGGDSIFGGGGAAVFGAANGNAGACAGAGGSGASNTGSAAAKTGGAGFAGLCVIWELY